MIEEISLADVATFGTSPVVLSDLKAINFLYGANGAGKTTISRLIADESRFPSCKVRWQGNIQIEAMVYNRDFIARNFEQSPSLPGVFTLGESNIEIVNKIEERTNDVNALMNKLKKLRDNLNGEDGKGGELGRRQKCDEAFEQACWAQKRKNDEAFAEPFRGYRSSAAKFTAKVLEESDNNSTAEIRPFDDLRADVAKLFADNPETYTNIRRFTALEELEKLEVHPILAKPVVGRGNIDIGELIESLKSSDWVRQGRLFHARTGHAKCPFCQQSTPASLEAKLNEYFDTSFERDIAAIRQVSSRYGEITRALGDYLQSLQLDKSGLLDIGAVKARQSTIEAIGSENLAKLASKIDQPSQSIELKTLVVNVSEVAALVEEANSRINLHNLKMQNLAQERKRLTEEVWKYVISALETALTKCKNERTTINKAIQGITTAISDAESKVKALRQEIEQLEKQSTGVQATIAEINGYLKEFGFTGFSLTLAEDGRSYCLKRENGADAKETLSEGERTFVTFLYFYCLIKGSTSRSGAATTRIVVFDDPVSSLDNDILFVVGSLIRGVFADVENCVGNIRQAFVLTHNVYFHKEVSYSSKRNQKCLKGETFWTVCKTVSGSVVTKHFSNPIQTSYELLWEEVRSENRNNATIQNTLRRILENYFKIIGGIDYEKVCDKLKGREKTICKSLCSWVHDGSHHAHDNLFVVVDSSMVGHYLDVFRKIFYLLGHDAHYKMMMKEAYKERPNPAVSTLTAIREQMPIGMAAIADGVYEFGKSEMEAKGKHATSRDKNGENAGAPTPTLKGSAQASHDSDGGETP